MPPLIGITAIPRPVQTMYGPADAHTCTDALVASVAAAGGVPVLLPVVPAEHAALQLRGLDGLVLAGGQDVDPASYGRPPAAAGAWVHRGRDEHELALLAAARAAGLPVLGVCRGLQLANVALRRRSRRARGRPRRRRPLRARPASGARRGGHAARARDRRRRARGQLPASPGRGLARRRPARERERRRRLPEAAEAIDGPWLVAVQWHPELMGAVPGGRDLFAALVRESAA